MIYSRRKNAIGQSAENWTRLSPNLLHFKRFGTFISHLKYSRIMTALLFFLLDFTFTLLSGCWCKAVRSHNFKSHQKIMSRLSKHFYFTIRLKNSHWSVMFSIQTTVHNHNAYSSWEDCCLKIKGETQNPLKKRWSRGLVLIFRCDRTSKALNFFANWFRKLSFY